MSEIVNKLRQLYDSTESEKTSMTEIIYKLFQLSGMLATMSTLEGCTITEQMTTMLLDNCEMLDCIIADLKKMEEAQ